MPENEKGSKKTVIYVILAIVVLILLAVGIFFMFRNNIKNETITAENYQEVLDKLEDELKDTDEAYYFSYAVMYHAMQGALTGNGDESAVYADIYGKTAQQLIDEGKKLMEDNGVTLEQFKQSVEELSNSLN